MGPVSDADPTEQLERGYYGLPVLKAPVWRWEIWGYFFLGGLAAGSFLIATVATLAGDARDRAACRIGFFISCAALVACPPLLIKDLGRPERFLNMLRVFKPGSPMSMGIWGLLGFSACVFGTTARLALGERSTIGRIVGMLFPLRPLIVIGSVLGAFVAGYTGVLLSVTSVPLWSRSRFLGPAFFASSLASGSSAIAIVLASRKSEPTSTLEKVERVKLLATVAEAAAVIGFLRQTSWAARPIVDSREHGRAFLLGAVGLGVVIPILTGVIPTSRRRELTIVRSLAALVGGVFLRYSIVAGGRDSAADPSATFRHTDLPDGKPR